MRVVVPYAAAEPKTRLADVLSPDERTAFAEAMLADVVGAIRATGREPEVLATARVAVDAEVTVDDRPLTEAVNAVLTETVDATDAEAVAVVMADLALATPDALRRLFDPEGGSSGSATGGEVAIAPGRGGGTNALVVRHPEFRVDYHGTSYLDHLANARAVGAAVRAVDSHRLATDVDERADLAEVLIHGNSEARSASDTRAAEPRATRKSFEWLKSAGFELASDASRVGVVRE